MQEMQQALHEILPNAFEVGRGAIHRWRYARPWPNDEAMATSSVQFAHNIWVCGDYLNGGRVEGAWHPAIRPPAIYWQLWKSPSRV